MKKLLVNVRHIAMAGLLFLLPVYVLLILIARAWTPLSSIGTKIAAVLGMHSVLGVAGSTVFAAVLLLVTWIACGLLVRFSFVAAFSRATEGWLSKNIPGYQTYTSLAGDKLHQGAKLLTFAAALIRQQDFWQPAFIVEHDANGNCVVFLPDIPDTSKGRIMLVREDQIRFLSSLTANQLDGSLKKLGKGLLSEYALTIEEPSQQEGQELASSSASNGFNRT